MSRGSRIQAILLLAFVVLVCAVPSASAAVTIAEDVDTVESPNYFFNFADAAGNVERVDEIKWRRDSNLAFSGDLATAGGGACGDVSEFWGESYGNADGQSPGPVVAGNRGTWGQRGRHSVEINTISPSSCSGDTPPVPVRTRYSFFDTGAALNTVRVERRWSFAANQTHIATLAQGMRAYVPRVPGGTFNQVIFPKADDSELLTRGTGGPTVETDWDNTWVALNASGDNSGMLILRDPTSIAANPASVTLDNDSASGSNNSGVTLDRPLSNWVLPVTETEYLCFYDATTWPVGERSPTRLPDGCKAATAPINVTPPTVSAGAGNPTTGEQFTASPGTWDYSNGSFAYKWFRCEGETCGEIPGVQGTSYTATGADVGHSLQVEVTTSSPGGESETAFSSVAGTISGHVYEGEKNPAKAAKGAPVQVCKLKGSPCRSTATDGTGFYSIQVPVAGDYRVTAFPPAGSNAASKTRETISRVKAEIEKSGQDVVLPLPEPPPPSVEFQGPGVRGTTPEGVPVVHWQEPFTITKEADCEAKVEARIEFGNGLILRVRPSGSEPASGGNCTFSLPFQPLVPNHGAARMRILALPPRSAGEEQAEEEEIEEEEEQEEEQEEEENEEPEEPEEEEETPEEEEGEEQEEEQEEQEEEENEEGGGEEDIFPIYIDPSGYVRSADGTPLAGATVTLLRADAAGGPFSSVPNGSATMSPSNRHNPDQSETDGHFGWDVIAGFYKVRVEKAGCHAPGDAGASAVETSVMTIPPPVTNLDLRLQCDPPVTPAPRPDPSPTPPRVRVHLPAGATITVGKDGRVKFKKATVECDAQSPCSVKTTVTATLPAKKKAAKAKPVKVATGKLSVAAGRTAVLEAKLSKAALSALLRLKSLKAKVKVTASVPGGEGDSGGFRATLKTKPQKRR
jgi:hypothetical protein